MRLLLSIARLFMLSCLVASAAGAQQLVRSEALSHATWILDHAASKNSLPCNIQLSSNLQLDLLFRYTAEFAIDCRLGEKLAPGTILFGLLRITPKLGKPALMTEEFDVPQVQKQNPTGLLASPSQLQAIMSGGFAAGPGEYSVEFVLTDMHGHTCREQRNLKSSEDRRARLLPLALQPGEVAPS